MPDREMPGHRGWKNVVGVLKELLRETSPHGHRSTFCVSLATPEAETRLATQVSRRHNRCNPPPHHQRLPVRATNSPFEPHRSSVRAFLRSDVREFGHSFLSFPDFLWAHRSGNSSPLRPTRLPVASAVLHYFRLARDSGAIP
jgi:hypothetical protein